MTADFEPAEGGCTCGHVRYRMGSAPLVVHCCHCRWCQRETGTAFALNAVIEADRVDLVAGEVEDVLTPTLSGNGQIITRCPKCRIALWSSYTMGGLREKIRFIRVGSLDDPDRLPPDVHIFTSTKQPWIALSDDVPVMAEFYPRKEIWQQASLDRLAAAFEKAGIRPPG